MVEIYSYNKVDYIVYNCCVLLYIPPKCAKTREPKDKCCVSPCTYTR